MRRALVTGSSGFVGRHLVAALQADDWDVTQVDLAGLVVRPMDDARVFFATDRTRFDAVVHAAAHVGGRTDIDGRPTFIGAYNLQLDGALFEWALRARPRQMIYLSSSAAYPVALQTAVSARRRLSEDDIDLSHPALPDATYGWVKLTGERLAAEACRDGLNVAVVRPFSGYGTDQSDDYPFGAFRERALALADPFQVWGDGQQVRDWIHIDDIVAAILTLIDSGEAAGGTTTNLCTGRGTSMLELARMFTKAGGYAPDIMTLRNAPSGVQHRVGDPFRMVQRIRSPKITIEEGVRRACQQ